MFKTLARSFSSAAPAAKETFSFQKYLFPHLQPRWQQKFHALEENLSALRAELVGIPSSIPEIDWKHWEKVIDDKQAVAKLKEDFLRQQNLVPKPKVQDLSATNTEIDQICKVVDGNIPVLKEELADQTIELKRILADKVDYNQFTNADWEARIPGMMELFREEHMNFQLSNGNDYYCMWREFDLDAEKVKNNQPTNVMINPWFHYGGVYGRIDFNKEIQANLDFQEQKYGKLPWWKDFVTHYNEKWNENDELIFYMIQEFETSELESILATH